MDKITTIRKHPDATFEAAHHLLKMFSHHKTIDSISDSIASHELAMEISEGVVTHVQKITRQMGDRKFKADELMIVFEEKIEGIDVSYVIDMKRCIYEDQLVITLMRPAYVQYFLDSTAKSYTLQ